jgi:hypothetical protein
MLTVTDFYAITVVKLRFFKINLILGGGRSNQAAGRQLVSRLTDGGKVCQLYAPASICSPETLFFFWH